MLFACSRGSSVMLLFALRADLLLYVLAVQLCVSCICVARGSVANISFVGFLSCACANAGFYVFCMFGAMTMYFVFLFFAVASFLCCPLHIYTHLRRVYSVCVPL